MRACLCIYIRGPTVRLLRGARKFNSHLMTLAARRRSSLSSRLEIRDDDARTRIKRRKTAIAKVSIFISAPRREFRVNWPSA